MYVVSVSCTTFAGVGTGFGVGVGAGVGVDVVGSGHCAQRRRRIAKQKKAETVKGSSI